MTNTKFRKRALLSSVAMLLVALVALGSATFAWFSSTNNATASSMTAKTNVSSNILLNEYQTGAGANGFAHDWAQTLTFNQGTSTSAGTDGTSAMMPVTTKDFSTWNQVLASNYNVGYATNSYTAVSNIKTSGEYAKYTTLYIKNTGEPTNANINVTATPAVSGNSLGSDYIRVALVPIAAETNGATAALSQIIFGSNNDRSNITAGWNAEGQTDSSDSIVGDTAKPLGTAQSLGQLAKNAVYGFDVYVYFEGTDFDCKDEYAGGNLNVAFEVTKAA